MSKYCLYCKIEILEGEDYVVRDKHYYHVECYELIASDSFGSNLDDYTETDYVE